MTQIIDSTTEMPAPAPGGLVPLAAEAARLMDRARAEGVQLVGRGGLLAGLTKTVLESALDAE